MSRRSLRALPVFWQILGVLLAAVVFAQAAGIAVLFISPPPRPQFNRLDEIAETLAGGSHDTQEHDHDRDLLTSVQAGAPMPRPRMVAEPPLTHMLAERLARPDGQVRLYFEPEAAKQPFRRWPRQPVYRRHGETIFFTPLIAAVQTPQGWRIAQTPPPPLIAPWQRRMILWFLISIVALVPLAWWFARALTRPISSFAAAADRLGSDPLAPAVTEEGPAELRIAAHALNRMQSRLADYVGERTAMIGAIAHDLRTPLARIAFRIEDAPDAVREKVLGDVEQMRAMLAATIGFVRNTEGERMRVPVDLTALVMALIEQDRDLGRDVSLASSAPAIVLGDPLSLERLLQNLIDNGIAYAASVEASVRREEGVAVVTIADRGPGMPAELLERAFQPFVRGDPSRNRATGGIGLGLTIARTIAENHGGTVTLANRAGGGLDAVLRLPLAP
ncbi:signal transduction histidine kinase [Sphingomonas vulcanisoli]|uniref:histidine kinase n=1 Tax=Sphingomonas vulcanisoli TaxID=1658060 RepID=A0ABX0TUT0_9SPHN|nr:ATP-binding protein [Sphingomonas vulcanisoli]NIJ08085.1 signal transduction histidine kinase [Sphingomonas vulcanisoli]